MLHLILILLFAPIDVQQTIREGVALYDAQKYDEAIAKYKAVLVQEPANELAAYELGLTYHTKGDNAACIATLAPLSEKSGPVQVSALAILANCLDNSGQADKAIVAYRRGLALKPDEAQLLYNLALTLSRRGENDEARELLKKELSGIHPTHASARLLLAQIFESQGFRAAAVLEYLHFLGLEPNTSRSKTAATRLLALLSAGVEKKGPKNINITFNPNTRKEEGDYSAWEMMMALSAAASDEKKGSEFDRIRATIGSSVAMLLETRESGHDDYSQTTNVAFMAGLEEQKLLDTFTGVVLVSLDLKGEDEWMKKNEKSLDAYASYIGSLAGSGQ